MEYRLLIQNTLRQMRRYSFQLYDKTKFEAGACEVLETVDNAKAHAEQVASELGARQTKEHNKNLWIVAGIRVNLAATRTVAQLSGQAPKISGSAFAFYDANDP